MKRKINDLLLKMQTGENCIGETANKLLDLYNVKKHRKILLKQVNQFIEKVQIDTNIEVSEIDKMIIKFK